jgi:hypothetical protein
MNDMIFVGGDTGIFFTLTQHKIILLYICVLDLCTMEMLFIIWWPHLPRIEKQELWFQKNALWVIPCNISHLLETKDSSWKDKEILKKIPQLNNSKKQRNTPNSKSQYIPKRSTSGTKRISTPSPSYLHESQTKKKTCQNLPISIWVTLKIHIFLVKWYA